MDFALWKAAKPGEPTWDSPWGPGRPGWHIECSVMSTTHLGETIDIHSGGSDLVFPHHENEIAESEAATGKPFVRFWIHNAFLNIGGEKMSKSVGNIVTMDQVLAAYPPMAVRYFFLSAHYRRPMDYGPDSLEESRRALDRLVGGIETIEKVLSLTSPSDETWAALTEEDDRALKAIRDRFCEFMDDDFNTPRALSVLFDTVGDLHEKRKSFDDRQNGTQVRSFARSAVDLIYELGGVLGLDLTAKSRRAAPPPIEPLLAALGEALRAARSEGANDAAGDMIERMAGLGFTADESAEPPVWRPASAAPASERLFDLLMEAAIAVRNQARNKKQYDLSDQIRAALGTIGIVLEDYRAGTLWRKE